MIDRQPQATFQRKSQRIPVIASASDKVLQRLQHQLRGDHLTGHRRTPAPNRNKSANSPSGNRRPRCTARNANMPVLLGLPGSSLVNRMLVVVVLWTTVKVPALMRRFVTHQADSTNAVGLVLRTVSVQGLTRNLLRRG
jgi:hypothetical protein